MAMTSNKRTYQVVQLISLLSVGFGSLTVLGYIVGNPLLYAWSKGNPMALNTSICFVLQGISLFLVSRRLFYTVK